MEIQIQLDDDRARKLAHIQEQTQQDLADLVGEVIDRQYARLQAPRKSAFEIFRESGFIGCIKDAPPNLSSNYKAVIREYLEEKHRQGRLWLLYSDRSLH